VPHAKVSEGLRKRAQQLRQTMTRTENLLWRYLKAHHVDGLAFRRQVPMQQFIADFICHSARIVVEIDGLSHDFNSRQRADRKRDQWFASQNYTVLRFTNEQVLKNLEGVIAVIRDTASTRLKHAPPSLPLPHKGGGNSQEQPATTISRPKRSVEVAP
jgi:very-short-patch-repair endonuclease